jgi:hypothetical protein
MHEASSTVFVNSDATLLRRWPLETAGPRVSKLSRMPPQRRSKASGERCATLCRALRESQRWAPLRLGHILLARERRVRHRWRSTRRASSQPNGACRVATAKVASSNASDNGGERAPPGVRGRACLWSSRSGRTMATGPLPMLDRPELQPHGRPLHRQRTSPPRR